ncbi:hypothetical protein SADUNF_Sadunf13G0115100 [Salix dunnii]|uniref:Myb-like domain-containing protein n=1 Tax=Salix dunnii TaxID=1413687 RepID=A0A835MMB2_9ROSI|nr:hypothetical protein SADUNF_Sadunf13G0115100 [Salix dunnii]
MVRSVTIDKNGLRKGSWSVEEDEKLRKYIQKYGHWNWRQLPKFAAWFDSVFMNDEKMFSDNFFFILCLGLPNQPVSSEVMNEEQSNGSSQSEFIQTKKSETDSVSVGAPSKSDHKEKNAENSLSSQEISCSELSSMSNDSVLGMNTVAEDCVSSMEIFQDSCSDFWDLPFLPDNNYNQDGYESLFLTEDGYMSFYASAYDDDGIAWIQ